MIPRLCPHCQNEHRFDAAFCGNCGSRTPVFVEINAAAQYVSGSDTFVEFRIANRSFDEVTLAGFIASINDAPLPFGVHELSFPGTLEADKATGLDFRVTVDAAPNQSLPLKYAIAFETSDGETHTFAGEIPVWVQAPDSPGLFLPGTQDAPQTALDLEATAEEEWFTGFPFGEAENDDPALAHIRELKQSKGVLFWPAPLHEAPADTFAPPTPEPAPEPSPQAAPPAVAPTSSQSPAEALKEQITAQVMGSAATTIASYGNCPTCSAAILQQGTHCHGCGTAIDGAVATMIHAPNPVAFCPHCQFGLTGKFPHCPLDGMAIPFHLEINELSLYMHEVSTKTEFRFHTSQDESVVLQHFDVALAEESLQQGANRLRKNHECTSLAPVLVDALVYPREANRDEGILGCPPGDTILHLKLSCVLDKNRYVFSANHEITVMKRNTDPSSIVMHLGDVISSGDGSAISTLHNKETNTVEMAQAAMQSDSVGDFIKKMKMDAGLQFRPVKFFLESIEEVADEIEISRPIDWNPTPKARLFFEHERRLRNYCLLNQSEITVGRKADAVDIRLIEIEAAMKRSKESSDRKSSSSVVSRKQWHFAASESGVNVTQLSSLTCRVSPGRALPKDAVIQLALNDYVEIPDAIGITVSAHEPKTESLSMFYQLASQYLKICERASSTPSTDTLCGAYTLTRRHSLAPEPPVDLPDTGVAEYYILLSGCASIGASPTSNIQITGNNIADTHAYILGVSGYYFIVPAGSDAPVQVNGAEVTAQLPYPLKPNDSLRFGDVNLSFADFSQMHIKN